MNKYLVVYRDSTGLIENTIVSWDKINSKNITLFETTFDEEDFLCVINIIKLEE